LAAKSRVPKSEKSVPDPAHDPDPQGSLHARRGRGLKTTWQKTFVRRWVRVLIARDLSPRFGSAAEFGARSGVRARRSRQGIARTVCVQDRFAAYNGTAPIEWSSGNPKRPTHRLSRRGNRAMNHALHITAVTQIRFAHSPGRALYERKRTEGNTPKEAIRVRKRRISNIVYRHLVATRHARRAQHDGLGWPTRKRLHKPAWPATVLIQPAFGNQPLPNPTSRYARHPAPSTGHPCEPEHTVDKQRGIDLLGLAGCI
jgi:hypothetical protein